MDISASYYTSAGGRSNNEDSLSLTENKNGILAIVADGLGGHNSGELASQAAVSQFNQDVSIGEVDENKMKLAVENTNKVIRKMQADENSNMKTTLAALWFDDKKAITVHVGDTRIYQFRNEQVIYQSIDHSVSQMAVLVGEITKNELRGHVDRNKLLRAIGSGDKIKPDISKLNVVAGDAFLLCTDGFWELILETEMEEDLKHALTANDWLAKMRRRVESRITAKGDNHTAIAVIINS